ncbi:unnamed protein product [Darwinula stevensoni]|uniref:Sushi domain-containing protein n=1 Tax=Darwinula stevensoni TaxID=69355 RepID=A0A7R9A407_9CRUS|nr:unnamed protein product [Darwinula stevensoni]CAG0889050.1 unnamed protein product [Darwinula stevensoni]
MALSCKLAHCIAPPPDMTTTGVNRTWNGSTTIGTTVAYTCPQNQAFNVSESILSATGLTYHKNGSDIMEVNITCLDNGTWSNIGIPMACKFTRCIAAPPDMTTVGVNRPPDVPRNGGQREWNNDTDVGTVISYKCPERIGFDVDTKYLTQHGFQYDVNSDGNVISIDVMCLSDGQWQGFNFSCLETLCRQDPPAPANGGTRVWDGNRKQGTIVSYSCPDLQAFDLSEDYLNQKSIKYIKANETIVELQITCDGFGAWQVVDLSCKPTYCTGQPPNAPLGGSRIESLTPKVGSAVSYRCPKNMAFTTNKETLNSSGIIYTETDGYVVEIQLKCTKSGAWETVDMTCRWNICVDDPSQAPPGGSRQWNGSKKVGDVANFSCPENHAFTADTGYLANMGIPYEESDGDVVLIQFQCGSDGRWKETPLSCKWTQCNNDPPPPPTGGSRNWPGSKKVGTEATYTCPQAYLFRNSQSGLVEAVTKKCQPDGSWEPLDESCILKCPVDPPPPLPGGRMEYDESGNAVYTCPDDMGYPDGKKNHILTCSQNTLKWEGDDYRSCIWLVCREDPPETPLGGSRIWSGDQTLGTEILFECPNDWRKARVTCSPAGNWTELNLACSSSVSFPEEK